MTSAEIAHLPDRGVVAVTGPDAGKFLDNIITNDMALVDEGGAIFAGLLSPQGKVLFEFFVVTAGDGYLLDVAGDKAGELVTRLTMYKLRAKVEIARLPAARMLAAWNDSNLSSWPESWRDPRGSNLGRRMFCCDGIPRVNASGDDYQAHRIALGVPEGGRDYAFGEVFPHEALFDQLNGVSFTKGCYVGQEIVARMEHRGTARKRFVRVAGRAPLPPMGTDVKAGDVTVGAMGSSAGAAGLALLRLDRVAEFAATGMGLTAAGVALAPDMADVARLMPKSPDPVAL